MIKNLLLTICISLIVLGCDQKKEASVKVSNPATTQEKPPLYGNDIQGQKAPELEVEEWLTEKPNTEGKVVLIDIWATWCGPCVKSIPKLNAWQKQFKDDLVIIAISDEETSKVKSFMEKTEISYSMAIDSQKRLKKGILDVKGIPYALIIDREGVVRWQGIPTLKAGPLTTEIIEEIIDDK